MGSHNSGGQNSALGGGKSQVWPLWRMARTLWELEGTAEEIIGKRNRQGGVPGILSWLTALAEGHPLQTISTSGLAKMLRDLDTQDYTRGHINWELKKGQEIPPPTWDATWQITRKVMRSRTFRIFAWKCLHRYFFTPGRLAVMFPQSRFQCWRCGEEEDIAWEHVFWDCDSQSGLRQNLLDTGSEIGGVGFQIMRGHYFLGVGEMLDLSSPQAHITWLILAVKKAITKRWKNPYPPHGRKWEKYLHNYISAKKVLRTATIRRYWKDGTSGNA